MGMRAACYFSTVFLGDLHRLQTLVECFTELLKELFRFRLALDAFPIPCVAVEVGR